MTDSLPVSPKLQNEFKSFLESKIASLSADIKDLQDIYESLGKNDTKVTQNKPAFKRQTELPIVTDAGYNKTWTWLQKIKYIFGKFGALTTSDVVAKILENEPDRVEERSKVVASVSAVLSVYSKEDKGVFSKTLTERNENLYDIKK